MEASNNIRFCEVTAWARLFWVIVLLSARPTQIYVVSWQANRGGGAGDVGWPHQRWLVSAPCGLSCYNSNLLCMWQMAVQGFLEPRLATGTILFLLHIVGQRKSKGSLDTRGGKVASIP